MESDGAYGPQTEEVKSLLACVSRMTREDLLRLAAAVHRGPKHQGRSYGSCVLQRAAGARAAYEAALCGIQMAATAVAARDSIGVDEFVTIYTPWSRAMDHWWRDKNR
jgi:hypothetical protein